MMYEARWEEKEGDMKMNKRCSFRRTVPTFSWRIGAVTITLSVHLPLVLIKWAWRTPNKISKGSTHSLYPFVGTKALESVCISLCCCIDGSLGQVSHSTYISPTTPWPIILQVTARASYKVNLLSHLDPSTSSGSWFPIWQRRGLNKDPLTCSIQVWFSVSPFFPMAKTETTSPKKLSWIVLWRIIIPSCEVISLSGD